MFDQQKEQVETELALSDKVLTGDLLRFYTPKGFTPVDKTKYSYTFNNGIKKLEAAAKELTAKTVLKENNNQSTSSDYQTNAPELK